MKEIVGTGNLTNPKYASSKPRKFGHQLLFDVRESSKNPSPKETQIVSKTLKLKSNSARGCTVSVDDLFIHFDENGIAEVLSSEKEKLELHMSRRPGRYSWVAESQEAAEVVPEIEEVSPVVELENEIEAALAAQDEDAAEDEVEEISEVVEVVEEAPKEPKVTTRARKTRRTNKGSK
jgi:hypothetical protein